MSLAVLYFNVQKSNNLLTVLILGNISPMKLYNMMCFSLQIGLEGEHQNIFKVDGNHDVRWTPASDPPINQPLTWYKVLIVRFSIFLNIYYPRKGFINIESEMLSFMKTVLQLSLVYIIVISLFCSSSTFNLIFNASVNKLRENSLTLISLQVEIAPPQGNEPVALDMQSMWKGQAWLNGKAIGRYWSLTSSVYDKCTQNCDYRGPFSPDKCRTGCGEISQRWYFLFLNQLVVLLFCLMIPLLYRTYT